MNSYPRLQLVLLFLALQTSTWGQSRSEILQAMDTNEDRKISLEEYLAFAEERAEKNGKPFNAADAENMFHKKDINKDGVLADSELRKATPQQKKQLSAEEQKKRIAEAKKKKEEELAKKEQEKEKQKAQREKEKQARKKSQSTDSDDD